MLARKEKWQHLIVTVRASMDVSSVFLALIAFFCLMMMTMTGCKAADPKVKALKPPSIGNPGNKPSTKMAMSLAGGTVSPDGGTTLIRFTVSHSPLTPAVTLPPGTDIIKASNPGVARAQ